MEFDRSRVYTALNADELKPGSRVIVADNLTRLKQEVKENQYPNTLEAINGENCLYRFYANNADYGLAYLVSKPKEPRRMTNKELAKWLAQGKGQWNAKGTNAVSTSYSYGIDDKELPDNIMIRGWDEAEWREPVIKEADK